jgi:hypothetical protein
MPNSMISPMTSEHSIILLKKNIKIELSRGVAVKGPNVGEGILFRRITGHYFLLLLRHNANIYAYAWRWRSLESPNQRLEHYLIDQAGSEYAE